MVGVGPLTSTIGLLREDPATAAEFMAWDVKVNAIAGTEQGCVESRVDLQIDVRRDQRKRHQWQPFGLGPGQCRGPGFAGTALASRPPPPY